MTGSNDIEVVISSNQTTGIIQLETYSSDNDHDFTRSRASENDVNTSDVRHRRREGSASESSIPLETTTNRDTIYSVPTATCSSTAAAAAAATTTTNANVDVDDDAGIPLASGPHESGDERMIRLWKASPFAVGRTYATWADEENVSLWALLQNCTPVHLTAWCCRALPVGRVGNMVVLFQYNELDPCDNTNNETHGEGQRTDHSTPSSGPPHAPTTTGTGTPVSSTQRTFRPKLLCVLGPYWMVLMGLTIPLITLVTFWTAYTQSRDMSLPVFVAWTACTAGLYLSLFMVACSDPGILYRHATPPLVSSSSSSSSLPRPGQHSREQREPWVWSDQALTFRPMTAKYDPECAAVIEHFDHTCPWTGTAIGRKNMPWFKLFVTFIVVSIAFNAVVLTLLPTL